MIKVPIHPSIPTCIQPDLRYRYGHQVRSMHGYEYVPKSVPGYMFRSQYPGMGTTMGTRIMGTGSRFGTRVRILQFSRKMTPFLTLDYGLPQPEL